jgi:hypothetical protein
VYWLRDRAIGLAHWFKDKAGPWLARTISKVGDWFRRHFGWLQTWVHRLHSILTWLYTHVLRPLFVFLEVVRAVLRVLASLGVKWAGDLERFLARLEQRLLNVFNSVVNFLNNIADILDALFDPTGAFKRKYFVWSLIRWLGDLEALSLLAGIDRNPWPEAFELAEGPLPSDIHAKGNQVEHDLQAPPPWVITKGRLLSELLG